MLRLILVIMVLHVGTTAGLAPCPHRHYQHWYQVGPFCARFFAHGLTFEKAEMRCRGAAKDGHLISIHDEQTNEGVRILTGDSYTTVWIGGVRLPDGTSFIWIDGSRWDYTNWARGEPNNSAPCLQFNYESPGKWDDFPCWNEHGYVCAFKI